MTYNLSFFEMLVKSLAFYPKESSMGAKSKHYTEEFKKKIISSMKIAKA